MKSSKFCNFFGSTSHWDTSYIYTKLTLNVYVTSALYYERLTLRPALKKKNSRGVELSLCFLAKNSMQVLLIICHTLLIY